ncbi:MAG: hypothetical protein HFJ54_08160 [Clostridia bacterium]|nr:hypothetical protein [Clostridia bacterium]
MTKKLLYIGIFITFFIALLSSSSFAFSSSSNTIYQGIDVSNWQGYINYQSVKAEGIDIVYIKSSQGTNITDPYFRINYDNAKANGLKVGFYHYLTARNANEAIKEAEYFSSVISGTEPDCKLAMDFEYFGNLNADEINNISITFLEKVKELTGKDLVIYSDLYNSRNTFRKDLSSKYPLWIAEYRCICPYRKH